VRSIIADGFWSALDPPPPLHSDRERCGVKDSFATMDLSGTGMDLLFAASWIHRQGGRLEQRTAPPGWTAVTTADQLGEWTGQHDTGFASVGELRVRIR
jgi:hypothetical protein